MQPDSSIIDTVSWKKRWLSKLSDRSRPGTPVPQSVPVYVNQKLDPFLEGKSDKLVTLNAEGIYVPAQRCPSCKTAEYVTDDVKEGCTVCTRCGLVLRERIVSTLPEVEFDAAKDSDDSTRAIVASPDNDPAHKPWLPQMQTVVQNAGGVSKVHAGLDKAHRALDARSMDLHDLQRKHSEAYDKERQEMLAERSAQLQIWRQVAGLSPEQVRDKIGPLEKWLQSHKDSPAPDKRAVAEAALKTQELASWVAVSKQTAFEIESKTKELQRAVEFLTTSHLTSQMSEEDKQKLHEELALRRFSGIAVYMHKIVDSLSPAVPVRLLVVAQEYLRRFVGQHDRRLNSRNTWCCCCLQLAAMYDFDFMFNERELRVLCSQPCMMKTLHRNMRKVRNVLQLPRLPPAKLVQLNRTYLQRPLSGSVNTRQNGDKPLSFDEQTRLDVLFSVVLELLYAVEMPKAEPFKPKPGKSAAAGAGTEMKNSGQQEKETEAEDSGSDWEDADAQDDADNEFAQQLGRQAGLLKTLESLAGSKRGRSSSGEATNAGDMPADKKHMPALRVVSLKQQERTDADLVQQFMRPAVAIIDKARSGTKPLSQSQPPLAEMARLWPDSFKNDTIAALQRRAPRSISAALFYLGVQAIRSVSMRFTMENVRRMAHVGSVPLRESKAQLLYFMAFINQQPNAGELLRAALGPYLSGLNIESSSSSSQMDTSQSSSSNNFKPSAATFMLCP